MSFVSLILISFAVSADALAVCLAWSMGGLRCDRFGRLAISLLFGMSASAMLVLGCRSVDLLSFGHLPKIHYVSSILICILGLRAFRAGVEEKCNPGRVGVGGFDGVLLLTAIASSLDCLAIGAGFELQQATPTELGVSVGVGSGLASLGGLYCGHKLACLADGNAECIAGLVLIGFATIGVIG